MVGLRQHDPMSVVWLNGALLAADEARIGVLDRGVIWGYGLFETLRAYGGRPWAFREHMDRLAQGAGVLGIALRPEDEVRAAVEAVLEANELSEAGVRVTVTAGEGPADPHAEPTGDPATFVSAWPLRDYGTLYTDGVSLVTLPGGGRTLAGVKATSYAVSVAGRLHASRQGADDALFVGPGEVILEATGSNLMAVFGASIVTPPTGSGLLPGVTRGFVLEVAAAEGYEIAERPLTLRACLEADEVFLTSSLREIYPVRSIDGRDVGRGDVTAQIRAAFRARVRSALEGPGED